MVEISPLAALRRNSKGKRGDFIYSANMLSNSKTPSQSPALHTALGWLRRAQQDSVQNVSLQDR